MRITATIYVDAVNGGYEASIETENGRYIRFSTNEQDAITHVCRKHGICRNNDNVRVIRLYLNAA